MTPHAIEGIPLNAGTLAARDPLERAIVGFLARYAGHTLANYTLDLKVYLGWCQLNSLHPLKAERRDVELYTRWLETEPSATGKPYATSTVSRRLGTIILFYKFACMDDIIAKDPAVSIKRPHVDYMQQKRPYLAPLEYAALLKAARLDRPASHALVALLGEMGLRISEACGLDVADIAQVGGYEVIRFIGKGSKGAEMPLPVPVMHAVHDATAGRDVGPVLLNRWDLRMTRQDAARLLIRLGRQAEIPRPITPHALRRTFVTAGLLNGVPLRDMQLAARHTDPKVTIRYDMLVGGHERSAVHRVAGYLSSMSG